MVLSRGSNFDDLQPELGGFSLEMDHLLFAVLYLIELGSLVYIFHSVAQHAVDEPGEFGGHGLGRHRRPQLCSRRVVSLPFNASNTRAVPSSLTVTTNRPSGLKATAQTPLLCPAGESLDSYHKILHFIRSTRTQSGMSVSAHLDRRHYLTGTVPTPEQLQALRIKPHQILPKRNNPISPNL